MAVTAWELEASSLRAGPAPQRAASTMNGISPRHRGTALCVEVAPDLPTVAHVFWKSHARAPFFLSPGSADGPLPRPRWSSEAPGKPSASGKGPGCLQRVWNGGGSGSRTSYSALSTQVGMSLTPFLAFGRASIGCRAHDEQQLEKLLPVQGDGRGQGECLRRHRPPSSAPSLPQPPPVCMFVTSVLSR